MPAPVLTREDRDMTATEIKAAVSKLDRLLKTETLTPSSNVSAKNSARCMTQIHQGVGKPPRACGKIATWQESEKRDCSEGASHKKVTATFCNGCMLQRVHTGIYDGPQMEMNLDADEKSKRAAAQANSADEAAAKISKGRKEKPAPGITVNGKTGEVTVSAGSAKGGSKGRKKSARNGAGSRAMANA